jgi:hypothetical protein
MYSSRFKPSSVPSVRACSDDISLFEALASLPRRGDLFTNSNAHLEDTKSPDALCTFAPILPMFAQRGAKLCTPLRSCPGLAGSGA